MVVLKFLTAIPKVHLVLALSWIIVQLCTQNKENLKFRKNEQLQLPEVNPGRVCDRRATGFAIRSRKLQKIWETNKGFLYNSRSNIFIYVEGNCSLGFNAINNISSAIRPTSSCRVPGSHPTRIHLCSLTYKKKTLGCYICPLHIQWQKRDGAPTWKRRFLEIRKSLRYWRTMDGSAEKQNN